MPALACCVDAAVAPPSYAFAGDSSLPAPVPFSGVFPATANTTASAAWSTSLSNDLYRIDAWGGPYFTVNSSGNVSVRPYGSGTMPHQEIDLLKIVKKVSDPKSESGLGLQLPLIVRFPDVLKNRLESLQGAFDFAIQSQDYGSHYQGVYPVKCNQDRFVVEDIVRFGKPFRFGLEAGSKPELLLAMSCLCKGNPESLLVCNGFKDFEYVSLALMARKLELNTVIVLEQEEELDLVIELSKKLGVRPVIGARAKLRTKHSGHFGSTSGEKGKFGLTTIQILRVVKKLEQVGMLDCFQLLHFHIGSQIPTTALLADGVSEAAQIYCELVRLGAHMKVIDIGGGLGLDYDGSKSSDSEISVSYGLEEYSMAVVRTIRYVCDRRSVKHPVICSESGRAIVSHHSVLIFEAVSASACDVAPSMSAFALQYFIEGLTEEARADYRNLSAAAIRGEYEACLTYADQLKQRCVDQFKEGSLGIEQLATVDGLCDLVSKAIGASDSVRTYNVNLSVFTSIPDTEGNLWLNETVGVIPKNSWAIDPFGYSSTMAYLLRRMGFENMLIQRTHYELKKELALHKNLEYIWRQSWDVDESTDIFVHMMPFYSYDVPHTCGPEPAICCQFDFARMRGFMYEFCPWGDNPVETNQENVQERALLLLDQYKKKSTLYRTNTLLIPLGDDFRYVSEEEAEAQFRNYQMLFDYINSNPSLNAEAHFGTLEDYFRTLREEAERINHTRPGEIGSGQVGGFPSLSGDFFTYADRQQDYWSGYYVSRPFFKAVDRVLEHTLRATDMMMAFLLGYCGRAQCEKLPIGFSYKLAAARRNLALFQHHDGVTGTAKDHVVLDYGTRMHTSLQDLQIFMSKAIEVLLGIRHDKYDINPSQFEPEQVRSKYDVQPVHRAIMAREGTRQTVVLFNPSEQIREEVVMVIVNRPDVTVLDLNWTCVPSQISPELQHDKSKIFTGRHRVYWQASVPALGLQTYHITNGFAGCEKAKPAKIRYFSKSSSFSCPTPYPCSKVEADVAEIQNRHQTLTFDVNHGLLQKISYKTGTQNVVGEEIAMYSSWGSGAYLFKPDGDAQPIIAAGGQMVISEGPLVQEVYSYPSTQWEKSPISHSTRLYNGENTVQEFLIEKEYHVELLDQQFNDRELIVRFKTDIDNKRVFFSDLNGFQMSRRETYDKIPLQGNYYPMPSLAFMQGSNGQRFSVHSRQSLGVASLKNGWLEIMLDRRLVRDDGRGLGQGVMDNRAMNVVFHILVEANVSCTSNPVSNPLPLNPSLLSHRVGADLNYPLHAFVSKKPEDLSVQSPLRSFSPLAAPLPCDLHIVSLKVPQPLKLSHPPLEDSRFVLTLQRQSWDSSYCRKGRSNCTRFAEETVNLLNMFRELTVSNARPTSLNLLHEDTDMLGYTEQFGDVAPEGQVLISPMEIQAYKMELQPHQ